MGTLKKNWHLSSLLATALIVVLVTFVARQSTVEPGSDRSPASRGPASIQKVFDYSHLEGAALQMAAQKRLLSSVNVSNEDGDAVIEVGNFVMTNERNEKDFACGYYDQVAITFDAEGVAVDGEKPKITVETGCAVADNINYLIPIHIPLTKLTTQTPGNSEYKFYGTNQQQLTVKLSNSPAAWPTQWVLTDIKMTHSQNPSRILHVNTKDSDFATSPILMKW